MDKLSFPYQTMVYGVRMQTNHLGVISFIWKVAEDGLDQTQIARLITKLNERQNVIATRQMRREFQP